MKKFLKSYCVGFIISVLLCGSVYAATYFASSDVTYDNGVSGLKSENVQDAIDELYGVCFPPKAGDTILDNTDIVTSGDGLYEDEYEDGRYFYKGANPNNYITFNNEQAGWRIVSIEPDGTIKIMRDASIGNIAWDTLNSNNWAKPASLNTYLNETYYNGLNSMAQSQIVAKDWGIGPITGRNNDLANQIYDENGTKWNGKIALVTVSEYLRSNSNKSNCGTFDLYNRNSRTCKNTTWMYIEDGWWTLSPQSGYSGGACSSGTDGGGGNVVICSDTYYSEAIRPALYLSSDIKITGGIGTQSNPYQILSTGQF